MNYPEFLRILCEKVNDYCITSERATELFANVSIQT